MPSASDFIFLIAFFSSIKDFICVCKLAFSFLFLRGDRVLKDLYFLNSPRAVPCSSHQPQVTNLNSNVKELELNKIINTSLRHSSHISGAQ